MSDDDLDHEVGYGRPPRSTRFRPGQSGNPRGRPRAAKNVGAVLEEVFFQKIPITVNGKRRKVTMVEAILRQLANGAAKGEMRHIDRVVKLLPMAQAARDASIASGGEAPERDRNTDRAVLETLADMFGSDPEALFTTAQGDRDDEHSES
ncbi:MAG: DUF5681 domain-containing protein [Pseudomonadota bacterium]